MPPCSPKTMCRCQLPRHHLTRGVKLCAQSAAALKKEDQGSFSRLGEAARGEALPKRPLVRSGRRLLEWPWSGSLAPEVSPQHASEKVSSLRLAERPMGAWLGIQVGLQYMPGAMNIRLGLPIGWLVPGGARQLVRQKCPQKFGPRLGR